MARNRNQNDSTAPEATEAEAPAVEATEAPAAEATVEPTEAIAEGTETPVETPAAEDLTTFNAKVAEAVEAADKSTGTVAEAPLAEVVKAYRELGAKGKREAKKAVQEGMREAVNEQNIIKAKSFMVLGEALDNAAASKSATKERVQVDPTEGFAARAVALRLANEIFTGTVPDGVAETWKEKANELYSTAKGQVQAYSDYLAAKASAAEGVEVAEPEGIEDAVKAAFRIAQGKASGAAKVRSAAGPRPAFDGPKRDIRKHLAEAFADKEVDAFMTVAEIKSFKSAEYGDDEPSSGAISSRLFPNSGKPTVSAAGVEPFISDGKKGARKVGDSTL